MSTARSPEECKRGATSEGYKVCSSKRDPNNECPLLGEKERCSACGFFWAGKTCLGEDPVKKAKKELKEEEAAEKKAEEKTATPKPQGTPKKK